MNIMRISELIESLEAIKTREGDLPVFIRDYEKDRMSPPIGPHVEQEVRTKTVRNEYVVDEGRKFVTL